VLGRNLSVFLPNNNKWIEKTPAVLRYLKEIKDKKTWSKSVTEQFNVYTFCVLFINNMNPFKYNWKLQMYTKIISQKKNL
jgi:hypothetical protein